MNFLRFRKSALWAIGRFAVALACLALTVSAFADERRVEKRVAPVYPEIAKRMRIAGIVHVEATVAPDGTVTSAKATNGNKMLTPAAEDAVKHWKFAPADSQSTVNIDINFEAN
ncbi:MAG TPA: energy transducer TonB [Pseudacidobacterium sp.]|jgi:TonB family protein|nr:energy transducer TonB [Pseudacidobacterium sp.]